MNRSRIVKVRVTETEYADWSKRALEASVSLSEAIRTGKHLSGSGKPQEALGVFTSGYTSGTITYSGLTSPAIVREPTTLLPSNQNLCPHGRPTYVFCPKCPSD